MKISIELGKDQMDSVKKAFRPVTTEEHIKVQVSDKGNVTFSTDDLGTITSIVVPTMSISVDGKEDSFFLQRKLLDNAITALKEKLIINVEDAALQLIIDGTDINKQLPIFEMPINTSFNTSLKETIAPDLLLSFMNRVSVSEGKGASMLKAMKLGKQIIYGSGQNFTVIKQAFKKIDTLVSPDFIRYMRNITSFGGTISMIIDKDDNKFIVTNDNVTYITHIQDIDFPDVNSLLDQEAEASAKYPVKPLIDSLNKLSIAIMDTPDQVFTMIIDEDSDKTSISVKDISNKISTDKWNTVNPTGHAEVIVNMGEFGGTLGVLEEDFDLQVLDSCITLEDSVQKTCLMIYS